MPDTRYKYTAVILRALSILLVTYGIYIRDIPVIAIGAGYWIAGRNPRRYRIVLNIGILFHILETLQETSRIFLIYNEFNSLTLRSIHISLVILIFNLLALILLIKYYPSPYPVLMNLAGFIFSPERNVDWIEKNLKLFRFLTRKSIIGMVEGLYYNSESFNIILEEGFLGFTRSEELINSARDAGLKEGMLLLDVGSGLGGPSCILASEFKIQVTGIDLLQWNVLNATNLAVSRNLSKNVKFLRANAQRLPFKDKSFDFVFGSDAWCHVHDRKLMLQEIARVLKKGGVIFFYDWLDVGGITEGFKYIYAFKHLETMDSYIEKLKIAGFEIISTKNDTEYYTEIVEGVKKSVLEKKRRIIDECGRELYDNWLIVVQYTLKMLYEKKLGHGMFIARKV